MIEHAQDRLGAWIRHRVIQRRGGEEEDQRRPVDAHADDARGTAVQGGEGGQHGQPGNAEDDAERVAQARGDLLGLRIMRMRR